MRPEIQVFEDVVCVNWGQHWTLIDNSDEVTTQYREPSGDDYRLFDEDEAIDHVLDILKDAGLSKKAWQQIADRIGEVQ
jgi:hypothetical protein